MSLLTESDLSHWLNRQHRQCLYALAIKLYTHHAFASSATVLEILLRHDTTRPHLHRALAKALQAQGKYDLAIQSYARSLRVGIPDAETHYHIAQCLIGLRRYALALQALDRCLSLTAGTTARHAEFARHAKALRSRVQCAFQSNRTKTGPAAPNPLTRAKSAATSRPHKTS